MQKKDLSIRKTESICPKCLAKIPAQVVEREGSVYLEKECSLHGRFSLLLSNQPDYYRELSNFYFPLMQKELLQRDFMVSLTNKCNLNCPICLASANRHDVKDYPLERLEHFLKHKKKFKIDLMGAEPTMRDDLEKIINVVKRSGNISALHTNGIKIADFNYLKRLKYSGLNEVHLQFDGFEEAVYEKIRGEKLLQVKLKALENLERLNIATDLVVTVVRGVSEKEMVKVLDFGAKHVFVKEIFFLGCRFLGRAKELPIENCFMPDELIDLLERETQGRISRENIRRFQKLYFAFLAGFSVRKCFYINHYIIIRNNGGYVMIDDLLDIAGVQKNLENFKKMRLAQNIWATPYLIFSSLTKLVGLKRLSILKEVVSLAIPFIRGFNLSALPKKSVLIGFISACDSYSLDYEIAKNCGKGAISLELGINNSGAIDNVLKDELAGKDYI